MTNSSKILIVEDDRSSALLVRELLKDKKYEIVSIEDSGEKAISIIKENSVDLVLMDITLDGNIDGIETARIIQNEFEIPHVYITAGSDEKTFERAKETLPLGYVLKPYVRNIFISVLDMALHRAKVDKELKIERERSDSLFSSIPDIMFTLNENGSFIDDIEAEIAGRVWPERIAKKALDIVTKTLKHNKNKLLEYSLQKEGNKKFYEARLIPSTQNRIVVIVRDITDKKNAENELVEYKDSLEKKVNKRTKQLFDANTVLEDEIVLRQKFEDSLNSFKFAVEQSPSIMIMITKDGLLEYVNKAFENISGYTSDELVGMDIEMPSNPVFPEQELWMQIKQSDNWKGVIYNVDRSGILYYLDCHVTISKDENGEISQYVVLAKDISAERREKLALEEVKELVEKTNLSEDNVGEDWKRWKDKMSKRNISRSEKSLFSNIYNSFTQGAGFGSLVSLLEIMDGTKTSQDDKYLVDQEMFKFAIKNVEISKKSFKTFQNIDWVDSNDIELESLPFDEFYNIIKVAIDDVSEYTKINNQSVVLNDFESYLDVLELSVHKDFFYQAIYEVLINALKFSPKDSFVIVLTYKRNNNIVLSVINDVEKNDLDAVGIPEDYEKVVLEPFYRMTKVVFENHNTLDFGLGTTLVDKIVRKFGGEFSVKNILDHSDLKREPRTRVEFTMSLPISNKE